MTFITGALIVTIASLIAIKINDSLPGGDLPDSFVKNNEQSSDNSSGH